jgi:hypothetical protein
MGEEASRATGPSFHQLFAGQSIAGSTPGITLINQSYFVSAYAHPASSTSQHFDDQTRSGAGQGCATSA